MMQMMNMKKNVYELNNLKLFWMFQEEKFQEIIRLDDELEFNHFIKMKSRLKISSQFSFNSLLFFS